MLFYDCATAQSPPLIDGAKWAGLPIFEGCPQLRRWFAAVSARPSAKA